MGLGLGVLTALLILLPGIAFVLGLSRLHNPAKPPTPFDQHFSIGLIAAIIASFGFHIVWITVWNAFFGVTGLVVDPSQALPLLAGDVKPPVGDAVMASVSTYPVRIGLYFLTLTVIAWFLGRVLNRFVKSRSRATWFDLLQPNPPPDFVWLTADLKMDDECYLFAGVVLEFNVDRTGALDRVVLHHALRRPLHCDAAARQAPGTNNGWLEIPGEFLVLQMQHVRTINIDYFFIEDEDDSSQEAQEPMALAPPPSDEQAGG